MISKKKRKHIALSLAVYGCVATGVIYLAIGVIAILSFLRIKNGGADESSLLVFLNDYLLGKILIWIILLGTLSYMIWRIYEAITDPYAYGSKPWGIAKRTGIALSTVADALIAYSAIQALVGGSNIPENGQPKVQREAVGNILQESWGQTFIIIIGAVVLIVAVTQFIYGITRGYRERLDIAQFSKVVKKTIFTLGLIGYTARGIIIGIIGFFFIKAGITVKEQYIVNTDKAFNFIGDHVGHLYFILVAIGTIFYGLFMFALGITYDNDKG